MTHQLFDYQAKGADILASRNRFGLHDEMGVGKTATTIGAIDRILAERGIIVCPAMLRENWIKEFERFSPYKRRICKGKNIHDFIAWTRGRFDILITSYEQATKWSEQFIENGELIDFMAFDEAHFLKNSDANRTRAILGFDPANKREDTIHKGGMVQWAEYAWHITGTPMSNDPLDVYTFLRFTNAMDLPKDKFIDMFFNSKFGTYGSRNTVKEEMLPTLQQLIYNNSIRRTHTDVGMELPPIHLTELLLEGSTIDIDKALEAFPHMEQVVIEAIESGDISNLAADHIAIVRRLVGKAKSIPYAEMLKMELDQRPTKRVVFCWHTEPLLHVAKYLRKYGYGVVQAYGDTKEADRVAAVESFMKDPNTHVFLGNIRVAGTGLTLTESYEIDMLESDWSPAGNAQAIKRVHRYGQTRSVHARFITLANSIDVAVNKTVRNKTASIAAIEGTAMTAAPLDVS